MNGYDDPVVRLHELLTDAMERSRGRPYEAPVTVAEIYQELVPYRAVRSEAGFGMNADYEDALLRLLAGEHDLARLEPEHARDEILRELRTVNPNVTIYRSYAGCDVWIRPPAEGAASRRSVPAAEPPAREESSGPAAAAPARQAARAEPAARAPQSSQSQSQQPQQSSQPSPAAPRTPPAPSSAPVEAPARESAADASAASAAAGGAQWRVCAACTGALPRDRPVRFCPACGAHQVSTPCRNCGEDLEPGWRYCVDCGADARPAAHDSA